MMTMQQLVCRCCLRENPPHAYNIFADAGRLAAELLECAPNLQLAPQDGLSHVMCGVCCERVRELLEFRRCCEESERELRQRCAERKRAHEEAQGLHELLECVAGGNTDGMLPPPVGDMDVDLPLVQSAGDFVPLELSLLGDLLPEEYNFDGILDFKGSVRTPNEEDPVISELLSKVNNDPNFVLSDQSDADDLPDTSPTTPIAQAVTPTQHSPKKKRSTSITSTTSATSATSITSATSTAAKPAPKSLHPCMQCEKKFTRNFQLKLHLISVHKLGDGLQYKCAECQKTFASRNSLNYHQRSVHSEERPFACAHCDRRFVLRTQLASHSRMHTGQPQPRVLECMECGKCWPTKSNLRTHMRSHVAAVERPFQCNECEKSFFTRGHLSSHLLSHSGEKPFACAFCDKTYQSISNLNNHLARHHADVAPCMRRRGVALDTSDREI